MKQIFALVQSDSPNNVVIGLDFDYIYTMCIVYTIHYTRVAFGSQLIFVR